jgi:rubrerythrin
MSAAPGGTSDLLVLHEEAIEKLYRLYADRFEGDREFWLALAAEEASHVAWLRALAQSPPPGVRMAEDRLRVQAIRTSLEYIEREISKAVSPAATRLGALSVAQDVESSMIERKYFEVLDADPVERQRLLRQVAADTQAHLVRVRERLLAVRGGASGAKPVL